MMDMKHCAGCSDDFYNDHNPYGVKRCWMLDEAFLKKRFEISMNAPMGKRRNYTERELPKCYKRNGFVFLDQIPKYAE